MRTVLLAAPTVPARQVDAASDVVAAYRSRAAARQARTAAPSSRDLDGASATSAR